MVEIFLDAYEVPIPYQYLESEPQKRVQMFEITIHTDISATSYIVTIRTHITLLIKNCETVTWDQIFPAVDNVVIIAIDSL